ncbi:MAG: HEAT repeat domain-containing protein, partial [Bacteroidetes bacterium]|nr:HEAT repeat domain-containing protein [Bacteroidota bacterium]
PEVENKYELLKAYMQKVVAAHQEENPFDQFFFFAGHGYNSESMVARLDEQVVLTQQLLGNPNINYMDHSMADIIKFQYMSELQRPELDMAIVHHHGGEQTEYLSGGPKTDSYMVQIEMIQQYLRGRLQRTDDAKEMREVKKSFMERYDLPSSWFDGVSDPVIMKKDSIFAADLDLIVEDFEIYDYKPNVRFIIFDACYNGSYHYDEYVAGSYISAFGKTVATQGNTVNSIQDKWPQEFIGLLSLGMRVGEWNKLVCYLETHIIGDPTYRFSSVDPSLDIQKLAVSKTSNNTWLGLLDSEYIDVQAYALRRLFENDYEKISELLLNTYKTSVYGSVRTECLILSSKINDENFIEILKLALFDDYELIQRFAVKMAGDSGDEELIPSMIALGFINMSERIEFNYSNNIGFFDDEKLLAEFDKQVPEVKSIIKAEEIIPQIRKVFEKSNERYDETIEVITNSESSQRSLYNNIRNLRNYNYHQGVPGFLKFLDESEDQELRQMLIEALGWFNLSFEKQQIIDYCNKLANDEAEPEEIRQEAKKTVLRLG